MASDPPGVETAEAVDPTKSRSSFVIGALKREMEAAGASGAEDTVIHRLVVALQAALIDAGFVAANPPGSRLGLLKDWSSGASSTLTVKYTLPDLAATLPEAEEGKIVALNYSLMPNFVMIYGCVPGAQPEVRRLCLELPKLAPLLHLDSNAVGAVEEKGILEIWRVLKDELCLPLMISFCQLNGLPLPPCLMALPGELMAMVLELVPGVDLAKVQCTCKELKDLAADNDLWERKFLLDLNTLGGEGARWSRNWKKWFEVAWTRKVANCRRQRKRPRPRSMDYDWRNRSPSPFLLFDDDLEFTYCSGRYMDYGWRNSLPSPPNVLENDDESLLLANYWGNNPPSQPNMVIDAELLPSANYWGNGPPSPPNWVMDDESLLLANYWA